MQELLTTAEMAEADRLTIAGGTPGIDLMEKAGRAVAEAVPAILQGRRVVIVAGPGNNGGDGYVIARLLREAGNAVAVIAPLDPATDAAKQARRRWGGSVETAGEASGDVFVDCLFGSGLARPLVAEHALLLRDLAARHRYRVAVDVPSGVASDTGAVLNELNTLLRTGSVYSLERDY
jgi:hydroxyethylthiazole kinase-like uncharacterized protein yjeF